MSDEALFFPFTELFFRLRYVHDLLIIGLSLSNINPIIRIASSFGFLLSCWSFGFLLSCRTFGFLLSCWTFAFLLPCWTFNFLLSCWTYRLLLSFCLHLSHSIFSFFCIFIVYQTFGFLTFRLLLLFAWPSWFLHSFKFMSCELLPLIYDRCPRYVLIWRSHIPRHHL